MHFKSGGKDININVILTLKGPQDQWMLVACSIFSKGQLNSRVCAIWNF